MALTLRRCPHPTPHLTPPDWTRPHGLVDQHHSDHVLQANVGDVAVVHHRGDRGGEAHGHALHLIGREGLLAADRLDRI
jgi:hypothetical protein